MTGREGSIVAGSRYLENFERTCRTDFFVMFLLAMPDKGYSRAADVVTFTLFLRTVEIPDIPMHGSFFFAFSYEADPRANGVPTGVLCMPFIRKSPVAPLCQGMWRVCTPAAATKPGS